MKTLRIDLSELAQALANTSYDLRYYLDREAGDIVLVSDEIWTAMARILDQIDESDKAREAERFQAQLQAAAGPEWEKPLILAAYTVKSDRSRRFVAIPQADSRTGYADMKDFIETINNQRLQDRLWSAIRGKGAFGRFENMLVAYPGERERWTTAREQRERLRAVDWLAVQGIEPELETDGEHENGPTEENSSQPA